MITIERTRNDTWLVYDKPDQPTRLSKFIAIKSGEGYLNDSSRLIEDLGKEGIVVEKVLN